MKVDRGFNSLVTGHHVLTKVTIKHHAVKKTV